MDIRFTGDHPGHLRRDPARRCGRPGRVRLVALPCLVALVLAVFAWSPARNLPESPPRPASVGAATQADLQRLWADRLARSGAPGGAFAIVDGADAPFAHGPDGVPLTGAAGIDGDGRPWTLDTPALWGSVAKPVAAAVAARVAQRGDLALHAPLRRYVDRSICASGARPTDAQDITVSDLIHHTSGIGPALQVLDHARPAPPGGGDTATPAIAAVAASGDALCPQGPRGTHRYSSANYLLLAAVLESATGTPYGTLVEELIGAPTGATSLVTDPEAAAGVPAGHRVVAGRPRPMATPWDEAGIAYGALGGSLRDLAAVAAGFLGDTPPLGSPIADPGVPTTSIDRYGAGWRVRALPDGTSLAWHSGMVPGYVTTIMVWPQRQLAAVTIQNVSGVWHAESLLAGPMELAKALVPPTTLRAEAGSPPVYVTTLAVAGAVATLTWLLALRSPPGWARRRRGPRRWVGALGWGSALLAVAAVACAAPSLGLPWHQAWLWLPDVTALLAATGAAIAVGAARRVITARQPPGFRAGADTHEGPDLAAARIRPLV